jgi:hypothetical protein
MSKNKLLVLAVAAALAAPTAFAATVTVAVPVTENSNQYIDNTVQATIPSATVGATASDNYLGRTVGYNVRVRLSSGKIATSPTITAAGGATSASLITGTGAVGDTEFVVRVVPNAAGTQVGEGFTISGMTVDNVATLGAGGTISLNGSVYDPTTAIELPGSAFSKIVYTAKEGVAVTVTPSAVPNVIDVGAPSSKRYFTAGGVGSGTNAILFDAGTISIDNAAGVTAWLPGTGTADIIVSGDDFSAFKASAAAGNTPAKIYLATDATCVTQIGTAGVITADNKTASFSGVVLNTLSGAAPFDANICFDSNSVTQIAKQDIKVSAVVKPGAAFIAYSKAATALSSMVYNGPVVNVYHFNPASNPGQTSYLRISNTSAIGGKVTIEGTCDNGVASATPASFTLAAGNSVLLTSKDIEQGNAAKGLASGLGPCAVGGKYRLVVTGEFSTMQVQNFLRNDVSAGTVNTNVNNAN